MYWDQFWDKYGFNDGDDLPHDAFAVRECYIQLVNAKAAALGSKCRLLGYSRPGVHNPCMLVTVNEKYYHELGTRQQIEGVVDLDDSQINEDQLLQHAMNRVLEIKVEDIVEVKVKVNKGVLQRLLTKLTNEK